jgi:hypothetical protein
MHLAIHHGIYLYLGSGEKQNRPKYYSLIHDIEHGLSYSLKESESWEDADTLA